MTRKEKFNLESFEKIVDSSDTQKILFYFINYKNDINFKELTLRRKFLIIDLFPKIIDETFNEKNLTEDSPSIQIYEVLKIFLDQTEDLILLKEFKDALQRLKQKLSTKSDLSKIYRLKGKLIL